ncbi:MAG: DUF502 domain-containing protein [Bacteroidia bacterium]
MYLLWKVIQVLDNVIPIHIPGLGLLTLLGGITLLGYISTKILEAQFTQLEKRIQKLPIIGFIYSSLRQLTDSLLGKRKNTLGKPVLVQISPMTYKIGFLTGENLTSQKHLATVYFPHSYAFSGELILVEKEKIQELALSSAEAFRYIVSGGIIQQNHEAPSPT